MSAGLSYRQIEGIDRMSFARPKTKERVLGVTLVAALLLSTAWVVVASAAHSITLVGASQAANGSGDDLTVPVPAGVSNGHLLLAQVTVEGCTNTIAAPSGWTLLQESDDCSSSDLTQGIYWKLASSEPGSYLWAISPDSRNATGGMLAYSGAAAPSTVAAALGKNSSSLAAPSVSGTSGDQLVGFYGIKKSTPSLACPTGTTQGFNSPNQPPLASSNATDPTSASCHKSFTATGSASPGTATVPNGSKADWVAHSVVVPLSQHAPDPDPSPSVTPDPDPDPSVTPDPDPDPSVTPDPDPDPSVTPVTPCCTGPVVNNDGTLIVEKQTLPDGATQTFSFSGAALGTGGVLLGDGQSTARTVAPGTYTVGELVGDGWELTSITCTDSNAQGAASTGDVASATATFRVDANETVECVFTNVENEVLPKPPIANPDPQEPREEEPREEEPTVLPKGPDDGVLPFTGSDPAPLVTLAGLIIMLGGMLTATGRRRRLF